MLHTVHGPWYSHRRGRMLRTENTLCEEIIKASPPNILVKPNTFKVTKTQRVPFWVTKLTSEAKSWFLYLLWGIVKWGSEERSHQMSLVSRQDNFPDWKELSRVRSPEEQKREILWLSCLFFLLKNTVKLPKRGVSSSPSEKEELFLRHHRWKMKPQ